MNRRMILYTLGKLMQIEAILLVVPLAVGGIYGENVLSFVITALSAAGIGTLFVLISPPRTRVIYAKEGFIIVALAWLFLSALGALPFYLSREIPNYVDAFFETVSGFTTTGASILPDPSSLSHGTAFWRAG